MTDYLKAFVVGSSFPTLFLYFYAVQNIPESQVNLNTYVFRAPLFLGSLNVLGLYLCKKLNLSINQRYLLTSIIGFLLISILLYNYGTEIYTYDTNTEWLKHILLLLIGYLVTFNIIVKFIEETI